VLADAQTAGRGRMRRAWRSDRGAGVWLTLLERPTADDALGVLALRLALALAPALDAFSATRIQVKWPNDLSVDGRKLAAVLVDGPDGRTAHRAGSLILDGDVHSLGGPA